MMCLFKMKLLLTFFCLSLSAIMFSQNNSYLDRLQAVTNSNAIFYNVDGVDITSKSFNSKFNEKDLKKILRTYKIKRKDPKTKDLELKVDNYVYDKSEVLANDFKAHIIYYVLDLKTKVSIISFAYSSSRDIPFERQFINDFLSERIPSKIFVSSTIDSVEFAGRKIQLGGNCRWMNVRNIQCPYYGQMNWSLHKSLEFAKQNVEQQFLSAKYKKGGKVISETSTPIIFEGKETIAKSVVYDITGVNSLLAGMSGAKTLTIYYVAEEIRGHFLSCVLSFWNNDNINESGLPALLEEVMTLKE